MIIYHMIRHEDVTGNSGTGHKATLYDVGGPCVLVWDMPNTLNINSIVFYREKKDAVMVHGHGGKTTFELASITPFEWWQPIAAKFIEKLFRLLLLR